MGMERSGGPTLRPKLERAQQTGPSLGQLIKVSALAAGAVGMLGVVVAAAMPSVDLFGIYALRETMAAATPNAGKSASPGAASPSAAAPGAPPAPAPAPIYDKPDEPPPDEAVATRQDAAAPEPGDTDNQRDRPPAAHPKPKPTKPQRSVERDMALLGDLRPAVALPPIDEVGDATLSYLHEAEVMPFADVQLVADLAALGDDQAFHFERDGEKPRWTIRFTGPPALETAAGGSEVGNGGSTSDGDEADEIASTDDDPTRDGTAAGKTATVDAAIADVWCVASSVMFHWREEARTIPAAEQLRNAAVQFTVGSRKQSMALREAVKKPVYTLDFSERTSEMAATIPHPPRAASLFLEVLDARDMPVNAFYAEERQSVALPTVVVTKREAKAPRTPRPRAKPPVETTDDSDAAKRVTVLFDKFVDGEQPQLWVDGEYDGAGVVTIRVAPRVVRDKAVAELTAQALETYRQPRQRRLASCERDWKNAHDAMVFLDRRMGEVRAGINPTVSLRALQAQYASAQRAYNKLDAELKRLKADLAWMDAADLLIKTLDKHGQLKYRVFAKSGDLEIDLIRGGME